jgi:cytoskeletal protein CcmA (bactofilin family)
MNTSRNQSGMTLVATLLILCALVSLTAAGLSAASSGLRIATNFRTGIQALLAAESGVLHAVRVLDGKGVIRFDADVAAKWPSLFGETPRTMPIDGAITYSVAPAADPRDPLQRMALVAVGRARDNARREVRADVRLDGAFSPGAIYLPATSVQATFNGNALTIDGRDHLLGGGLNAAGEDRPGIALLNPNNVASVRNALKSVQEDNVTGVGGAPSVLAADGPSRSEITNEIVPAILSRPGVVTNPVVRGNDVFGTRAAPQITYFPGAVKLSGTTSGAGILIVDQALTITGNMNFTGLIIVRGTTEITEVQGNVAVLGAMWTTHLSLNVSGSASVTYSSEALETIANFPFGGNVLPQRVRLHAWMEI